MTAAAGLVLLAGFLVGATTLGGLLVVPALTGFASIGIDRAVAIASVAFIAPSILAAAAAWREREQRRVVTAVAGSAFAGAAAGALLIAVVPAQVTMAFIALLALVGGLRGLARDRGRVQSAHAPSVPPSIPVVVSMSGVAGVLSAITGTGGPVALWPLLGLAAQPLSTCWIAALAIQLPVAVGATATHAWAGRLEPGPAAAVAAVLTLGFFAGRKIVARTSLPLLGRAASVMLLVIAAWMTFVLVR